jgi:hypothetical protein
VPTPSHRSSLLTLRGSSPDAIVIELKDVLQLGVGLAGWGLAAYQYWRNELTKRPFVAFHHAAFKSGASTIGGTLMVRNRGPSDIVIECLRVTEPDGARLCFQSGPAVHGRVPIVKRRARTLEWRLPGFGSGEFPSKSEWFEIDVANEPAAAFVELEVVIALSRPTMFSRRFTKRHRIRRVGKKMHAHVRS